MNIPVDDIAIYDTSSYSILHEKDDQNAYSNMITLQYLKPVELNPLDDKLYYLSQFQKVTENWDGYGAKSPSQVVIKNAISFLKLLPANYQKLLNLDEMNITPYGTVVMEWFNADNFISIEIANSKIGFFSETPDGENPLEQNIEFVQNEVPHQILPVFNKVFSKV